MSKCGFCGKPATSPFCSSNKGSNNAVIVSFAQGDGLFCSIDCATSDANRGCVAMCEQEVVPRTAEPETPEPSTEEATSGIFQKAFRAVRWLAITAYHFLRSYS